MQANSCLLSPPYTPKEKKNYSSIKFHRNGIISHMYLEILPRKSRKSLRLFFSFPCYILIIFCTYLAVETCMTVFPWSVCQKNDSTQQQNAFPFLSELKNSQTKDLHIKFLSQSRIFKQKHSVNIFMANKERSLKSQDPLQVTKI